jgi:nicotinamidase-related amidase
MDRFLLPPQETALLMIDFQEKLAAVMKYREEVVRNGRLLIEAAGLLGIPVWLTEQYPQGLGSTLPEIRGLLPEVQPLVKTHFDCCREPGFLERITRDGRKRFILTGMEAHVCVLLTASGLLRQGFKVQVVRDAVCSRKKTDYQTALEWLREAGAVITTTETVIFQFLERSGTEAFKTLSQKIR